MRVTALLHSNRPTLQPRVPLLNDLKLVPRTQRTQVSIVDSLAQGLEPRWDAGAAHDGTLSCTERHQMRFHGPRALNPISTKPRSPNTPPGARSWPHTRMSKIDKLAQGRNLSWEQLVTPTLSLPGHPGGYLLLDMLHSLALWFIQIIIQRASDRRLQFTERVAQKCSSRHWCEHSAIIAEQARTRNVKS
ncbi:hypothetical protein C8R44DRAFT_865525 [Mycena epipterygia]|nr:hypothetical protein C8R44DRAFT_865525 [Mycena epipterygia]